MQSSTGASAGSSVCMSGQLSSQLDNFDQYRFPQPTFYPPLSSTFLKHSYSSVKGTETKEIVEQVRQEFAPKEPQFKSLRKLDRRKRPTKNAESNIINQAFAFVCSLLKSSSVVLRLIQKLGFSDSAFVLYYAYADALKTNFNRKYRSRQFLTEICTNPECESLQFILNSKIYKT